MPVSMYKLSVPVFIRGLNILANLLDKAEAHAAEHNIPLDDLFNARLAPDMLALSGQIQRVSDTSKNTIGRLSDITVPSFPDEEKSFADLRERTAKTIAFLETVKPSDLEGSDTRDVTINFGKLKFTFTGDDYMLKFAIPNFFFHVTTTHDILRNQGVAVGKADFLGAYS
ncbi:MAG TPA: DUF1993 domain-containing protein [Pararhizobium sp.]|uniref:DUF1993 domain-containing protein n=1 Tax=Pararhizobium sp. TaxID=1977563 RepID=UPI002CF4B1E4|nr:DUF1993 domain-containing protein [Pararhizobium sp.]HTO33792.1 DUF1993 domain-containing protein [Pararhizobium sp.]